MFRSLIIQILLLVSSLIACAQNQLISGEIKDTNGVPLSNVSVTLRNEKALVLSGTYTNEQGKYSFSIPDSLKGKPILFVWATYLGYKKKNVQITTGTMIYNLVLESDPVQLSEVNIKNKPNITKKGDTLSYDVNSFARSEDRSIGDVIKRMPGFTVEDDGRILFNGQAISNLYTGDDDLMGGKYGLATKSISKDMIKKVEVLKNHQPIKVLKDKVFTNDVAVNLVLRDENSLKLTGEGMIGGGLPSQFDASGSLIALSKKLKMLNNLMGNNSGIDFRSYLKNLGSSSYFGNSNFAKPPFLTNSATIGPPNLPLSNYYFNKSGIINLNNLINTKKELQFRFNLQGFLDKNDLVHLSNVATYLANDTVVFNERQSVTQKTSLINTGLLIAKNNYKLFLNNNTNFSIKRDLYLSPLNFNGLGFNQSLTDYEYDFSNNFSYIPTLKNDAVMSFNWNVNYFSNPQKLRIDNGLNADVINNGIPYNGLFQQVKTPTFFSGISFSYIIPNTLIKQNYQAGITNEFKELNSNIILADVNNIETNYTGDAGNSLKWQNHKVYVNPNYNFKTDRWQVIVNVPVQLQLVNYKQIDYQLNNTFKQISVNPTTSVNLKTGNENYLAANFSYINNVGDITSVYRGNLLANYRTIRSNSADLQTKRNLGLGLKYHLEKSINLIFANVGINFNQIAASSIAFTLLSDNVQKTVLIPLKNKTQSMSVNTDFSKHFLSLNSKVQTSVLYSTLKTNLFLNNQLLPYVNDNLVISFAYDTKLINALSINYNVRYNYTKGGQKTKTNTAFDFSSNRVDQFLTLGYSASNKLILEANSQYIYSAQQNNLATQLFLINFNLKYRFSKPKIELGADVRNLLNVKEYTTSSITSNQLAESSYNLRGRMALLRLNYIF